MKKAIFIPILALIFVVGMSFTTFGNENDEKREATASDYVYDSGNWQAIPEQNCTGGTQTCRVQFGVGGPIYDLYDEMDLNTLKKSSVDGEPIIINP